MKLKTNAQKDQRWHVLRRLERKIQFRDGVPVISLGRAQAWDYGDLVRLRESAGQLFSKGYRRIDIDMRHVVYLPSGFMNMLCEWTEKGFVVRLLDPVENVRRMLWFREFMQQEEGEAFRVISADAREALRYSDEDALSDVEDLEIEEEYPTAV